MYLVIYATVFYLWKRSRVRTTSQNKSSAKDRQQLAWWATSIFVVPALVWLFPRLLQPQGRLAGIDLHAEFVGMANVPVTAKRYLQDIMGLKWDFLLYQEQQMAEDSSDVSFLPADQVQELCPLFQAGHRSSCCRRCDWESGHSHEADNLESLQGRMHSFSHGPHSKLCRGRQHHSQQQCGIQGRHLPP